MTQKTSTARSFLAVSTSENSAVPASENLLKTWKSDNLILAVESVRTPFDRCLDRKKIDVHKIAEEMREKHKTISWRLFNSIEDIAKSEISALGEIKTSSAEYTLLAMFTTGTRVAQLVNSQKNTSKVPKTIAGIKFPFYIMDDGEKLNPESIAKLKKNVFGDSEEIKFVQTNSKEILESVRADMKE